MTDALVVDASVAVKWFVVEDESATAERLLNRTIDLYAPTLLKVELANALRKNVRRQLIGREQATEGLAAITRTIGRWHEVGEDVAQAFAWSLAYDHPVYDFCYLALARRLGVRMLTADMTFISKLQGRPEAKHAAPLRDFA